MTMCPLGPIVTVQMQTNTEQCGGLLQCICRCGFEVIGKGDDVARFSGTGDPAGTELAFDDTAGLQLSQDEHFIGLVQDLMPDDGKGPLTIKGIVQTLDHGMAFDVIQHLAKVAFTLFDLLGGKGSFEDFSVHGVLLSVDMIPMVEYGTALAAFGFIYKGWIKAGKVLWTGSGLAKDFQLLELGYLVIQTTGTIKLVPDIAGVFVILEDHMVQVGHRGLSPFDGHKKGGLSVGWRSPGVWLNEVYV
ncbi:hypothetical protein DESC_40120 [Desulfosarcina cetonica]|nr:hypothetical protein DESC_40120 [Desulfosarcina cetonica]